MACQRQGDGTHAAVQVQRLGVAVGGGPPGGTGIEVFGLAVVHLIEGQGGQAEGVAHQVVFQPLVTPKGATGKPQHPVAPVGVHVDHNTAQGGNGLPADVHQQVFPRQLVPEHHQCQMQTGTALPHINVPQQTGVGGFVIGLDLALVCPAADGFCQGTGLLRLQLAALQRNQLMAAAAEKAIVHAVLPRTHRELCFVAVALNVR